MSKFTTSEKIIGGMFTLIVDVIAALLDFVPAVGWFLATTIQGGTSFATTMWVKGKGGERATKLERQFIKQLSNALPWVPTCFASFFIEVVIHNKSIEAGDESKIAGSIGKGDEKSMKKAA